MSDAQNQLDLRLAKGEITPEEYKTISEIIAKSPARLTSSEPADKPAEATSASSPSRAYAAFVVVSGLIGGGGVIVIADKAVGRITSSCMRSSGNTYEFCYANGVSWPFIYMIYAFGAILMLGALMHIPYLGKKN